MLFGELLGIRKSSEVFIIILIGCAFLTFDSSLFNLKSNLQQIWDITLDLRIYPIMIQIHVKYLLIGVVLTRAFTVHLTLALYIVMLWPAIFEERHSLLLPWLLVSLIRNLATSCITLFVGTYLCLAHEGLKPICVDYIIYQFVEHGPSVYGWFSVLSFYKDLKSIAAEMEMKRDQQEKLLSQRRKKARTMSVQHLNFNRKADDGRNLISESTIGNLLHHLNNSVLTKSRSLDTLLSIQAVEDEKEEIMNTFEDYPEDEENKNVFERAKVLLNIVSSDISKAKKEKSERTLKMLSDITLDALSFIGTHRILSTVSSASFFVKNGIAYKYKNLKHKTMKRIKTSPSFYEDTEEESKEDQSKKNENELVNLFFESKNKQKNKVNI